MYISENRALTEAVQLACDRRNIDCRYFSDNWVIRLEKAGKTHFVYASGFDTNSHASARIANDKVATYLLLADDNIAAIPHFLLSTVVEPQVTLKQLTQLLRQYGSLVIKPTEGSRGELVAHFDTVEAIESYTSTHAHIASWAASPFVDIQREVRLIVYNQHVQLAYEKVAPMTRNNLKLFNLNLGAKAKPLAVELLGKELANAAVQAMEAIGLQLGAVDIVYNSLGQAFVLEINSGFSLEHFAQLSSRNRQAVIDLYLLVIDSLFPEEIHM